MLGCLTDSEHDAFQILHHLIVGESEHAISARGKPSIAPSVVANTLVEIMTFSVDFDDEFAGARDEVSDVVAHWALPTKSKSGKSMRFQMAP